MNAAAIATAANPSTVERNGRCEVIGFSIQLLVEPGVSPGEGITSPKSDVFAATWRKKFDRRSIRDDAFAIAIN
jgi:hypothetical protein